MSKQLLVSEDLHRELKILAAKEGKQLKNLVEEIIKDYLDVRENITPETLMELGELAEKEGKTMDDTLVQLIRNYK
ncbi:MAG: hypothetical protein ACXAEU_24110 [Candidatus Hodarchaeales archaeon]|jgi:hypothetical protein